MEYKSLYNSSLGTIILTSDGKYLTGLWFTSSRFSHLREVQEEDINDELEIFKKTKKWLDEYFKGNKPNPNDISMKLNGTDFSKEVWEILKTIPYGKVITYGDIAKILENKLKVKKMSSQAVGHAVGYNPISIIIPCHRVVGAHGNLTGYGGGLDVKIGLLKIEQVNMDNFYKPKKGNAL